MPGRPVWNLRRFMRMWICCATGFFYWGVILAVFRKTVLVVYISLVSYEFSCNVDMLNTWLLLLTIFYLVLAPTVLIETCLILLDSCARAFQLIIGYVCSTRWGRCVVVSMPSLQLNIACNWQNGNNWSNSSYRLQVTFGHSNIGTLLYVLFSKALWLDIGVRLSSCRNNIDSHRM